MIFTLTPVIPLSALLPCHFNSTTVVEVEERGWKQSAGALEEKNVALFLCLAALSRRHVMALQLRWFQVF